MKFYLYLVILLLFMSCATQETQLDGATLLKNSIQYHDPNDQWEKLDLNIHIQEPRIQNTPRYSKVKLNYADGTFELLRNYDQHIAKYTIDKVGNAKVYLDDRETITDSLIAKYRLNPGRNKSFRNFINIMYSLPMCLNEKMLAEIGSVERLTYNGWDCYKIAVVLKEEFFSKHWNVYISVSDYKFKGMEMVFPEDHTKGERLYFDGEIIIKGVKIPRIRHWYTYKDHEYLGSDIILKTL